MSDNNGWTTTTIRDLIIHHASGPSPTCDERPIASSEEWGLLKTTAVTWDGWNATAHKVPPQSFWGKSSLLVQAGDVLITKAGPRERCGVTVYVTETPSRLMVSGKMILLRPNTAKVDAIVLSGVLASEECQRHIDSRTTGMADSQLNFTNDFLLSMPVTIPSLPEQRKIAHIFTTLDRLIKRTEALIAKYQAIKQGMMHDLFIRGMDENGHLRPTYAEAPELYKKSELGWIPKEWDAQELGAVVPRAEYGISVSLDDEEGIPVLRMNNLTNGRIDVTEIKCSRSHEAQRLRLQYEDVLFNRTNSIDHVGRTSIWRNELPEASFASYLVRLIPDSNRLIPQYLVFWLNLPQIQLAIRQFATPGVHQVNINPTNLRRTLIALPTHISEQSLICKVIQQQDAEVSREARYLAKLRLQKSGLMQDLLTGKVRVSEGTTLEAVVHA